MKNTVISSLFNYIKSENLNIINVDIQEFTAFGLAFVQNAQSKYYIKYDKQNSNWTEVYALV